MREIHSGEFACGKGKDFYQETESRNLDAMALKAALMMGEGARGQETREAQRRASSGMVRARLARERATLERAVRAGGGRLLS